MSFFRVPESVLLANYINSIYEPGDTVLDLSGYKGKIAIEAGMTDIPESSVATAFKNCSDVKSVNYNGHPEVVDVSNWNGLRLVLEYLPNVTNISLKQIKPHDTQVLASQFCKLFARGIKVDCDPALFELIKEQVALYLQGHGQKEYVNSLKVNGWDNLDKQKFQNANNYFSEKDSEDLCRFVVNGLKIAWNEDAKKGVDRYLRSRGQKEYADSLDVNGWKNIDKEKLQAALDYQSDPSLEEKSNNRNKF